MGLDSIELVMEVEDRFQVKLPDAECERIRTVADLAALVIARLPRTTVVCPTTRGFFDFRRLLMTHDVSERSAVRPQVRLDCLFPPERRNIWKQLCRIDRRLPDLVASDRHDRILSLITGLLLFSWLMATGAFWGLFGVAAAMPLSIGLLFVGFIGWWALIDQLQQHFPRGIETVGDIARVIAPMELPMSSAGERLVVQQQVLEEVRRISADQLGMSLDKVHPNSDYVKDLGID